jgi:hypothetical protein
MDILHLHLKLGASPRLEWWNAGIVDKWILKYSRARIPHLKIFNQFEHLIFNLDGLSHES